MPRTASIGPGRTLSRPTYRWEPRRPPALAEQPHPLTPLVRAWVLVLAVAWTIGRDLLGRPEGLRLPPLTWAFPVVSARYW